jgi:hypothetical protein
MGVGVRVKVGLEFDTQHHGRTAALPHCRTAALPHCRTAALPHCRTAALPHGGRRPAWLAASAHAQGKSHAPSTRTAA